MNSISLFLSFLPTSKVPASGCMCWIIRHKPCTNTKILSYFISSGMFTIPLYTAIRHSSKSFRVKIIYLRNWRISKLFEFLGICSIIFSMTSLINVKLAKLINDRITQQFTNSWSSLSLQNGFRPLYTSNAN